MSIGIVNSILNKLFMLTIPLYCINPPPLLTILLNKFDFIIVGAGSAGSVLANRLTENPNIRVLLLEAGGCPPIPSKIPVYTPKMWGSDVDWNFKVAPQKTSFLSYINHQPNLHQGKMLGGSSCINDMMYIRGNSYDYDHWNSLNNPGWGYDDVLPFFKLSERNTVPNQKNDTTYHNTKGPLFVSLSPYTTPSLQNFLLGGQQKGYSVVDVNGKSQEGFSPIQYTMTNGARWSVFDAYLKPAKLRQNLVILSGAYVTKVLLKSNQAEGVEFTLRNAKYRAYASKEVIISAGAIGSPKVLLLSGIGNSTELRNLKIPVAVDLPGVGKNLQDHVGCGALYWKVNCSDCTYSIQKASSLPSILQWAILQNGLATLSSANEGVAFVKTKYAIANGLGPDIELQYVSANTASALADMAAALNIDPNILSAYFGDFVNASSFTIYPFNVQTKSRGSVTLISDDPAAEPVIDFGYFSDSEDMDVLVEGVKIAFEIGNSSAFQSIGAEFISTTYPGCENIPKFSDAYWKCIILHFPLTTYHASGSCKMGNDTDPMAVVNAQLEVRNVSRLRVVDASVMPQQISGNPNAPTIMIAEKASVNIKQKYNF